MSNAESLPRFKPLLWTGSSRRDLRELPRPVQRLFGYALWEAQLGGRHEDTKILKGFGGAGVLEIVEDFEGNAYRAVYTVRFAGVVIVLHVFQKKSKKGIKTPPQVIELIRKRLKLAEEIYEDWRNTQTDENRAGI
jgi:phage-related protein